MTRITAPVLVLCWRGHRRRRRLHPIETCSRGYGPKGLERSQAAPVFDMLTVTIGPRLTASPAHKRAAEWARDG